jgi:hypothetical protein
VEIEDDARVLAGERRDRRPVVREEGSLKSRRTGEVVGADRRVVGEALQRVARLLELGLQRGIRARTLVSQRARVEDANRRDDRDTRHDEQAKKQRKRRSPGHRRLVAPVGGRRLFLCRGRG